MEISSIRDLVISVLGILYIILTIGIIVGLFIVYFKLKHFLNSVNNTVRSVHKWVSYIQGLAKGLNESVNVFKKGGV